MVAQDLTLWPAARPVDPIKAVVTYDGQADPFAVRLAFMKGRKEIAVYTFARILLMEGLHYAAGRNGDVQVGPHEELEPYLVLTVTPVRGHALAFYVERRRITDFVAEVFRQVPAGSERIDWDPNAELAALLDGAA